MSLLYGYIELWMFSIVRTKIPTLYIIEKYLRLGVV